MVRKSLPVFLTVMVFFMVLVVGVRPGSALDDAPLPPIGGDVLSVDTEGFYAVYRCSWDSIEIDDVGLISDIEIATVELTDEDGVSIDEMHTRFSWADGRMMFQIVESGLEPTPLELLDDQRPTGLDNVVPRLWLPLDGSSYVLSEGWSVDRNNSPYAVDRITYSDLVIEPAPVTTLVEHGWEWNVVPYVGGYTYVREEVDDDGGPTRTTNERSGLSYTAWYHEGTGLLLATGSTLERTLFETNYERHDSSGRLLVHPLGVVRTTACVLVDTNLDMSGGIPGVSAGVLPGGDGSGDDGGIVGEGPVTDTDETGADGDDGSGEADEDEVDPRAQAAAAGATALLAGGWLIAETVNGRRRRDESGVATVPLTPTEPIPSDMTPTEEDRYWDERNRRERAAALRAHQRFADDQWGKFTDRCREQAAADRAAAAAERHDRQLRRTAADRLETMATDKGYRDFVEFLNKPLKKGRILPSWHQLEVLRDGIVKRVGDQAAIDKYYEKSDLRVFAEGYMDTLARGVGRTVGATHGSILGKGAEWAVRNPLVPLRIGLAVGTGGYSELALLPFDAWDAMEAAADQKMAEQNLPLTRWEATKQVLWTGAWHVGGELVGDGISKISKLRSGAAAASREATEEAVDVATRRATRRAGAQTGNDFIRRVEDGLAAKRAAREAGEELSDAAARRSADALDHGSNPIRTPRDGYVKNWMREGEAIPRNHLHETGIPDGKVREIGRICRDEAVTADVRTVNMDSMDGLRDGTGRPKPLHVKSKTINEIDTYLGAREADRGRAGLFEPTMPANIDEMPPRLRDEITDRFNERVESWDKMSQDPGFQEILRDQIVEIRDGVVFDVATGQPYVGDIDLVCIRDADTGKILTHGPRYDRVMAKLREVGFQHGGEVTIAADMTSGLRPGTPEYAAMFEKAMDQKAVLQARHRSGDNIVVRIGADGSDGVVRRGPRGADINLTPSADEILADVAESAPAAGSPGPVGETGASGPPRGTGGAAGSTIGREFEETPDA